MLQPFTYQYRMQGWYDGDSPTIDIDLGFNIWMRDQKIRLYGVDTPELRGDERERGLEVRDIVRKWAPIQSVGIIKTHKDKAGKFGRWLGEIYPEGWTQSVNHRLFTEKLAEIEAYTPAERRKVQALFAAP